LIHRIKTCFQIFFFQIVLKICLACLQKGKNKRSLVHSKILR